MHDLGIHIVTFGNLPFADMLEVARRAEAMGYSRIYTTESLTDSLALDMAMSQATERIVVGSSVAIIYNRHPHIAAQAATTISDLSGGRFILGLGPGHPPRVRAMGINIGRPLGDLGRYVREVRAILTGETVYEDLPLQTYQGESLQFRRPRQPVPIYIAAVGTRMAQLGGELADGLMLYLVPRSRLPEMKAAAADGARRAGRVDTDVELSLSVHAFVSGDIEHAYRQARETLSYWVGLPAYNRSIREAGFRNEADRLRDAFASGDQAALRAGISDELIEQFCVVGPPERCRERLQELRAAGADFVSVFPHRVEAGDADLEGLTAGMQVLAPARAEPSGLPARVGVSPSGPS